MKKITLIVSLVFLASFNVSAKGEKNPTAVIKTSMGNFTVELYQDRAPNTVKNFIAFAKGGGLENGCGKKFWVNPKTKKEEKKSPLYTGTIFHRVIPNFMIQGGDPLGTGTGGPGCRFADETKPSDQFDKPGILAMANAGPNTNGSQFFVTVAPTPWLNGKHTIFGKVIKGYKNVEKISKVQKDARDRPLKTVKLKKIDVKIPKTAKKKAKPTKKKDEA